MSEKQPFILFITGTSASGKTTLYEHLAQDPELAHINFRDIDENGVPPVGRGAWRAYRVEQLLYEASKAQETEHQSSIVCGISFPDEIITSSYYNPSDNIHFLLAQTSDKSLRERLLNRAENQKNIGEYDESFDPENIEKTIRENIEMRQMLNNIMLNQRNGYIVDASEISIQVMCSAVKEHIAFIEASPNRITDEPSNAH